MIKSAFPESEDGPVSRLGRESQNGPVTEFSVEEVTDPAEIARCRAQQDRARRNIEWLEAHWPDVLPQAGAKFLAVAEEEAFLADTPEAAWAWVAASHPNDDGALVQCIRPQRGLRIYATVG
jgi:hypothetical protein